ncbi:TPA: hypothetical protein QIF36_002384 [Enterobacter kobei]|nr:hypothetical protein [Enterobacter kobei]
MIIPPGIITVGAGGGTGNGESPPWMDWQYGVVPNDGRPVSRSGNITKFTLSDDRAAFASYTIMVQLNDSFAGASANVYANVNGSIVSRVGYRNIPSQILGEENSLYFPCSFFVPPDAEIYLFFEFTNDGSASAMVSCGQEVIF